MSTNKTTMKAAQFKARGGKLVVAEVPIPEVKEGWVRIKTIACGVCAGDHFAQYHGKNFEEGVTPGHEIIGTIDEIGKGVNENDWKVGKMVGLGWYGGCCFNCEDCKQHSFKTCGNALTTAINFNGGYAEYLVAPVHALVAIPDSMDPITAAPLLCAGLTVFNSIRNQGLKAGSLVGVQGIGGLGHLGISFCKKLGFQVVAISSGSDKEVLSKELGADYYIDTSKGDEKYFLSKVKEIGKPLGCILATAPNASTVQSLINSLSSYGKLVMLAAIPEPFNVSSLSLILGSKSIIGFGSGDNRDSLDTLKFAKDNNIKSMVQTFNIDQAQLALDSMGKSRFRNVIVFN